MSRPRALAATSLVLALGLAGCGGGTSTGIASPQTSQASPTTTSSAPAPPPSPTTEEPATGPGEPTVYASIAAEARCNALQASFDTAADNNALAEPGTPAFTVTLDYMRVIEERRQTVGC